MEEITAYKTEDGRLFEDLRTAEQHEAGLDRYAVFRVGSNGANQHMCHRMIVWAGYAASAEDAEQYAIESGVSVFHNQYIEGIEASKLRGEDLAEYNALE